jgi:hypothetical protein
MQPPRVIRFVTRLVNPSDDAHPPAHAPVWRRTSGVGLALLGPPSWAAESWIGRDAARRPVGVAMRGLAVRDLAMALGAIDAVR